MQQKLASFLAQETRTHCRKKNHPPYLYVGLYADLQVFPCNDAKGLVLVCVFEQAPLNEACRS